MNKGWILQPLGDREVKVDFSGWPWEKWRWLDSRGRLGV